jgi:hypothetical protein
MLARPTVFMPESTRPVPVCPIHATFMVPYECEILGASSSCFRCAILDCPLVYAYCGVPEGYYKIEGGELRRVFPAAGRTNP